MELKKIQLIILQKQLKEKEFKYIGDEEEEEEEEEDEDEKKEVVKNEDENKNHKDDNIINEITDEINKIDLNK